MGLNRRGFLTAISTLSAGAAVGATPTIASEQFTTADLRGSFNAEDDGLRPGAIDDQSRLLQAILERAAAANKPVFLPPGNYHVSNITLPANTRLMGVPGASRLIYGGGGHLLLAENGDHVELTGLVLDGINRPIEGYSEALLRVSDTRHLVIDNCELIGSAEIGLYVDRSSGRIENSRISGAAGACGFYGLENRALAFTGNTVADCSSGGILVHRWTPGEDGTIVSGNRVSNIGAANGGTGQWGNGINVFRADAVIVSNNHVSDCAFSAIRSNAGTNIQIANNTCLRSGETAIYSEFEFTGAVISGNLVDTCARGISVVNFMQGGRLALVANNIVRNAHGIISYDEDDRVGIGIGVEAETTVTGNVVETASHYGLSLGWGPYLRNVVATSNVLRGVRVGVYVSVVEGSGPTVITDNIISDYSTAAVMGFRWHDAATRELAGARNHGFDHLTVERNATS